MAKYGARAWSTALSLHRRWTRLGRLGRGTTNALAGGADGVATFNVRVCVRAIEPREAALVLVELRLHVRGRTDK